MTPQAFVELVSTGDIAQLMNFV